MPSLLIATKKNPDGTVLDRQVTPFDDVGAASVLSQQEHDRLKALGYEVEIRRERHDAKREGGELLK